MKATTFLPILVFSVLLAGCASQGKTLAASDWKVANGRDVVVVVPQPEAGIHIDPTNTQALPQTGLLGAVVAGVVDATIDNVQAHRGEAAIGPIRDALVDYDFGGEALGAIKRAMDKASWFDVKNVTLTKDGTSQHFSKLVNESAASQVLFVCADYEFSPNLKTLRVNLNAVILPKTSPPTSTDTTCDRVASWKALYYHKWFYRENLYLAGDAASNARLWADDSGMRVRGAVSTGITKLVNELMVDLYEVPAEPDDTSSSAASTQSQSAASTQPSNTTSVQPGRRGPVFP
ncbi:hypothetical protein [Trinickia sp.]|uniref:hypothetical protein n=1 Tax=Trinickia sp. TaxID=2571163 RepID=UPI003F7D3C84